MSNQQQLFSFMEVSPSTAKPSEQWLPAITEDTRPISGKSLPRSGEKPLHEKPLYEKPVRGESQQEESGSGGSNRESALKALRAKVGCIRTARANDGRSFSSGCEAVDDWLPAGGLHPSTLTEWIAASDSAAAGTMSMLAAASRLRQIPDRPLVVVDSEGSFYPPAAAGLGVSPRRMILLRPRSGRDTVWAIDQALRSGAVAAVWASLPMRLDERDARRFQLAAETGRTPGLFVRDFHARGKPSFSEVQFYVADQKRLRRSQGASSRVSVRNDFETISLTLERVRGGMVGRHLELQIDASANVRPFPSSGTKRHETAAEHLAARLANPTIAKRVAARRSRNAS